MISDQLLAELQAGDRAAFEKFYNTMAPRWLKYFTNPKRPYRLSQDDAEDVVQQTMLVVFTEVSAFNFTGKAGFATWCHRIAIYKAVDRYRERAKFVPIEEADEADLASCELLDEDFDHQGDPFPSEEEVESWLKGDGEVLCALRSIDKWQRYIVLLRAMRGLTYQEIADKLGEKVGSVRVTFFRAKKNLEPLLQGRLRKINE